MITKNPIFRLTVLLGLLLLTLVVVIFVSLNSLVKTGVEKVGPMVTKTAVRLEGANLSPLNGSGELKGLFVGNPAGYKTPSAITAQDIKVNLDLKSAFSEVVMVRTVEIEKPVITFEGGLTGSNIKQLLDNISSVAGAGDTAAGDKPAEGGKKLKIVSLVVKEPKVNLSLKGLMGGKSATIVIPDIHLTDIGMDENGVSTAEVSQRVVRELLAGILKALPKVVGRFGGDLKDIGSNALEETQVQAKKTTQGIKKIFGRR